MKSIPSLLSVFSPKSRLSSHSSNMSASSTSTPQQHESSPLTALRSLFSPKEKKKPRRFSAFESSPSHPSTRVSTLHVMTKDYSKQGTTLRQIMDHAYWGPQFREYAASRHADESILFLNELSAYKCEGQSRVQQEQFAAMLMDTYFTDSAPKWVNLASRTREALLNDFASSKYATVHDLFKEAMHEAFSDIKHSETFKTFCLGEEAQQFCNDADTLLLDDLVVMENFIKLVGFLHGDKEMIDLLRFCCSVAEFERLCETAGATPGSDKKLERMALRNKISATFVQPGSRLQLENLPQLYVDAILAGGHDHVFSDARIEALQIFCLHQEFMASCRGMSGMVQ